MATDLTTSKTVTFSTLLPHALDTQIHVRLTTRDKCLMLFVTGADEGETLSAMGSFVYAVPDVSFFFPFFYCFIASSSHMSPVML